MVLDVIAREITRRFERALSPSLLSFFPPFFPPRSFTFHHSLASPHRTTTFLLRRCTAISPYTRLSSPPLRQNVYRETRVPSPPPSTGEQPLWHRREPALISHLPLFFISDIRIYHRDPAGTPLEGRGRGEGRGWRRIKGHGGREKGRGRIPLKKDGEAPTIIGRVGLPRSLTIIDPHSPRRREWIQTLSISSIMCSFSICLYLLLLLRDGESCAAVQP